MALKTYDDLMASIAGWLNKTNLTAVIPDFITLAEDQLNLDLDCREMSGWAPLYISGTDYPLPCGFDGVLSLRLAGDPDDLPGVTASDLDGRSGVGKPTCYAVLDRLILAPAPDVEYEATLRYRKRLPQLSATQPTNWLLCKHSGAYLYGALMQAAPYLDHDERVTVWNGLYRQAVDALNQADKRTIGTLNARGRPL